MECGPGLLGPKDFEEAAAEEEADEGESGREMFRDPLGERGRERECGGKVFACASGELTGEGESGGEGSSDDACACESSGERECGGKGALIQARGG